MSTLLDLMTHVVFNGSAVNITHLLTAEKINEPCSAL